MNREHDTARDLLLGLLALQTGLIDQAALVAAFHAWTQDKARPLADHLVALGHLDPAHRPLLEGLAAAHLARHGGDAEQSLAALAAGRSTRESLAQIGDADIEASLAHVGSGSTQHDGDPDRTATYSVGTATSDGQRFRVLRPHANGGLGAVFVALDAELHREVALKQILDHHADDPVSRQRFLLEAEVTGGLEHPGIVPVYGLGTYGDGRPYYAMRFIRGDSLKEAIDRFHADEALKGEPEPAVAGATQAPPAVLGRLPRHRLRPLAGASSTAISSRATSSWANTARRWSWTGAWPRRRGQADAAESSEERPLVPSSAGGSVRDVARHRRWARRPT